MSAFGTPTKQQLVAVMRCRDADMSPMVEMFEAVLDSTMKSMVHATDPVVIHRLQGRAQILKDLFDLIDKADQIMGRLS